MYLRHLTIENVRCFRNNVSIDFRVPLPSQPSWTLILGDNGTGKTSLLRAIAMGLCDETSASGLLRELRGDFIREDESRAEIVLELGDAGLNDGLTIKTTITRSADGTEEVKQQTAPQNSALRSRIFACGYGARRAVIGSEQYERYRLIESLYTLFNYEGSLLNPEVYLLRLQNTGVNTQELLRRLETILLLPSGSVRLDRSGFVIQGPWGTFVPVGSVGDGYASTLSWVCDMFGWSSLFRDGAFLEDLQGIVLLDELEQHLHPSWQRQLISQLAQAFPRIQFVATTHSPLTVTGSASLPPEACQVVLLEQKDDEVIARAGLESPRASRADQVLTSFLFGLASTTSDEVASKVARFSQLSSRGNLTEEERAEKERLHDELRATFASSETALQEHVRQAVHETLRNIAYEGLENVTAEALDLEVRRQLAELFGAGRESS